MLLKKIKIHNIRSYSDAEFDFPKGSVLLSGDIGAGKTSILLAIEFALFGLQPGQKGASLLKNGKDSGFVELEIEVEGKVVKITRNLKRKKTISQESATLEVDGRVDEKAVTEMKNYVLNLLNYPLEFAKKTNLLYRFTVYTPQEQMKEIILENPENRLNTLRHIFGIDKYKRIKENTGILTAKLRELSRVKQGQIGDLETMKTKLENHKSSLGDLEKTIPEMEKSVQIIINERKSKESEIEEVKDKIDEKKRLENEVEKTNILITTKKEQRTKAIEEMIFIKEKLEQATKDFDETLFENLQKAVMDKKQVLDAMKKDFTEFQIKENSFSEKKEELESLKRKIESLTQCPTCLQNVENDHKHNIISQTNQEISQILAKGEQIVLDKTKKQKDIEHLEKDLQDDEASMKKLEAIKIRLRTLEEEHKKLHELEKQKVSLTNDISMLEEQITRLKETILSFQKYANIAEIKEKELQEIKERERREEIKKAETVKEVEFTRKSILELEDQVKEKENLKKELMHLTELENWLSLEFLEMIGYIEKNVMIKLRDEFSKLFNEWFSTLVPDVFNVRLDEDFTPIIEQQDYEIDYSYLSGGERTAIALAYRLALNQTINSLMSEIKTKGLVILDEPTDGFSQEQLNKMRDVLQQLNVEQLVIVSHDQKMESFVDNIIRLEKTAGSTQVSG